MVFGFNYSPPTSDLVPVLIQCCVVRVHPSYWQRRLQQYKAAGLNTIDVYVPWNLHEPQRGQYDFGDGSSQFSPFLNITRYDNVESFLHIVTPVLKISRDDSRGGHVRHLPARSLHLWRVGVRRSPQLAPARPSHVLPELLPAL